MNRFTGEKHSIDKLFSILLFGMYILFLLLVLLFGAKAYQTAVKGTDENRHLRTAMSYITTKIRQHDSGENVFVSAFNGNEALCMTNEIDGETFVTYIYLYEGTLKELFTAKGSTASPSMGTSIASLDSFVIDETPDGFFRISMVDTNGTTGSFLIHPGAPLFSGGDLT